jgi:hypothetical protein
MARFDFSDGDARLEVKSTSKRIRAHSFSFEQCNPPGGTRAVLASIFVERAAAGIVFRALIRDIEDRVVGDADLVFKLHDTEPTATTMRRRPRLILGPASFCTRW